MKRIRVLVVDDSVVVRRILKDVLTTDPEVEVVGVAANGRIALSMIDQLNPDVVTLDLEMPEMDGLEVLRQVQTTQPQLPVIIFSTHTQRGAVATLEALALGARDYVTKPAIAGSAGSGMEKIREELLPRLKALCGVRTVPANASLRTRPAAGKPSAPRMTPKAPIEILAIGSSTGGPNALAEVLPRLPADFPVPVVVVQHMPPTFTRFLAERLNTNCQLRVAEAAMDQALLPGTIWIAPGDFHMSVYAERANRRLRTHQTPPENSCRPSVDVLFRSIAEIFGGRCLAVVMTGMGQDGLRGAEHLHRAGAQIVVQDEETSVVWGMPGYIARAGLADQVLPLSSIAMSIVNRVKDSQRPVPSMGEPVGCRLVR